MKLIIVTILASVFLLSLARADISFVNPTLANGSATTNGFYPLNVSINVGTLSNLTYNWNGTNYSMYDDSLVLMMNFDNRSSLGENDTYVVDMSKYSNNGTVSATNSPYLITDGKYDKAMKILGYSNSKISVPYTQSLSNPKTMTVSAWVRVPNGQTQNNQVITGRWATASASWVLMWSYVTNNKLMFVFRTQACDGSRTMESVNSYNDGNWHLATATYNSDEYYGKLYIDGGKEIITSTDGSNSICAGEDSLTIGNYFGDYGQLNGDIDELRIWNRSLSATEISELYMSNLYKYNLTQWYLYVNQSRNSTTELSNGTYIYQVTGYNDSSTYSTSDFRTIIIGATEDIIDCWTKVGNVLFIPVGCTFKQLIGGSTLI